MNEFAGSMQDVESALEQSSNMLGDIESILGSIAGIFSVASMGVGAIVAIIQKILENNKEQVEAYKSGKDKLFGFFVGQAMKETKGRANPQLLNQLLKKELEK